MENASRALVMVGGVLIGIMVASFMVLMLRQGGKISAEYDSQIADNELAKFNSQFEIYDKEDNTFFDIITVVNLAYDINKKNEYDAKNCINVTIVIDEGSKSGTYVVTPDENLKKNYFTKGSNYFYMYDFVEEYTANTYENGQRKYQYTFKCEAEDTVPRIGYNTITGKVNSIRFEVVKNY